jgi:hypothetical protein
MQLQGSATATIRVRRIAVNVVATAGPADNAALNLARRSTANGSPGTVLTGNKNDLNDAASTAVLRQIPAPGAAGTLVGTMRQAFIGIPIVTANNGGNRIEWDFGALGDECIVLRGVNDFLACDFSTSSGTYVNNVVGWDIEWTEE